MSISKFRLSSTKPTYYNGLLRLSPDNKYIATTNISKLLVYKTAEISKLYYQTKFKDEISDIEWSYDSKYLLVSIGNRNICIVKSIAQPSPYGYKIEEGLFGISNALFLPISNNIILTFSQFNLRITIWNISDKDTHYINSPKFHNKGYSFSSWNSSFLMALAQRKEQSEYIGIFRTSDWCIMNYIQLESFDLQDIAWTHDNDTILVIESILKSQVYWYSASNSKMLKTIVLYENILGIDNMKISLNGATWAFGCMDGSVHWYNNKEDLSFIDVLEHGTWIIDKNVNVIKEEVVYLKESGNSTSIFKLLETPFRIEQDKEEEIMNNKNFIFNNKNTNKIHKFEWSDDSNYLASVNDSWPKVLFIWNVNKLVMNSVLIFNTKIKEFKWALNNSANKTLFIVCESTKAFLFDPIFNNINWCQTGLAFPPEFAIWSSNAEMIVFGNSTTFMVCKIHNNEDNNDHNITSKSGNFYPQNVSQSNTENNFHINMNMTDLNIDSSQGFNQMI